MAENNVHRIALPIKVESRNILDRQHWAEKRRNKKTYALLIRNQMRLRKIPKAKEEKHTLIITSYRKRRLDPDNLVGGCKQLIDALVDEEFIFDDSSEYIDLHVEQHISNTYLTIITRK